MVLYPHNPRGSLQRAGALLENRGNKMQRLVKHADAILVVTLLGGWLIVVIIMVLS